jgi:hypothetical protein
LETFQTIYEAIGTGLLYLVVAFLAMGIVALGAVVLMIPLGVLLLIKTIISGMIDMIFSFIGYRLLDLGRLFIWTVESTIKILKYPFVYLGRLKALPTRLIKREGRPSH